MGFWEPLLLRLRCGRRRRQDKARGAALACNLASGLRVARINARRLTLSEGVLRYEDGLVSKTQRNIMLDKVRDVSMNQTLGQRLVGVGDLAVEALGESGNITLENVDRPRQAADAILAALRQSRQSNR